MDDFIPDSQFQPDPVGQPVQQPAQNGTPGPDFISDNHFVPDSDQYGGVGQTALLVGEKLAKGFAGPVATLVEGGLSEAGFPGLSPEEQAGREAAHPILAPVSEIGGFGLGMLTGTSEAGLLAKAGDVAAHLAPAIGIGGRGAGVLAKIGSGAVRGAVENALFQSGDEVSKYINDPNSVEGAIPHIGLASVIGGTLGGAGGAVSSLWRATVGQKAGAFLNTLADKVGGIEGVEANPVQDAISQTGLDIKPEIQAGLSNDPVVRDMFDTLDQSDTTNSGREFQQTKKQFYKDAGDTLSESLGVSPEAIPDEFDKYSAGNKIGHTLATEIDERVNPLKRAYDKFAEMFKGKDLAPTVAERAEDVQSELDSANSRLEKLTRAAAKAQTLGDPAAAIEAAAKVSDAQKAVTDIQEAGKLPGTIDILQDKIATLANDER